MSTHQSDRAPVGPEGVVPVTPSLPALSHQPDQLARIDISSLGPSAKQVLEFAQAKLPHVMTVGGYHPVGPSVSYESGAAAELLSGGAIPFRTLAIRNSWQNRFPQSDEFHAAQFAQWLPTVDAVLRLPQQDAASLALCKIAERLGIPVVEKADEAVELLGKHELGLRIDFKSIGEAINSLVKPPTSRPFDLELVEKYEELGLSALQLKLPRIYVAGPYSSEENRGTLNAFAYGTAIAPFSTPLVPHYTHDWDTGISLSYQAWLCLDACILPKVDLGCRLTGKSSGADGEIAVLQILEKPVYDAIELFTSMARAGNEASSGAVYSVDGERARNHLGTA